MPLWPKPFQTIKGTAGIIKSLLLNNKRHLVTLDTNNFIAVWDIISCVKLKDIGSSDDFAKVCQDENTQEWVANWCTIDTKHGVKVLN